MRGEIIYFDEERGHGTIETEEGDPVYFDYASVNGIPYDGAIVELEVEDFGYGPIATTVSLMGKPNYRGGGML
jgi:cold shock CspA family protein